MWRRGLVFALAAMALLGAQGAWAQGVDSYGGTEVRRIAEKLQCPVCEGQSVAESHSQVAADMRAVIATQLENGATEAEVMAYFEERYGPGVLRNPPATGFYSAVWWVPGVVMLIGAAAIYGVVRRKQAQPAFEDVSDGGVEEDPDLDRYRSRIEALEEKDSR